MHEVDLFDAYLGGAALILVVVWWMIGVPIYYRPRARKMGATYSLRQAIKDASPGLLLLSIGFTKLAPSHYFPRSAGGFFATASLVSIMALVLSFVQFPFRTTDEQYERWKILKEIEESPDGISPTLERYRQSAGRSKKLVSSPLLLIGLLSLFFALPEERLSFLPVVLVLALISGVSFLYYGKLVQRQVWIER